MSYCPCPAALVASHKVIHLKLNNNKSAPICHKLNRRPGWSYCAATSRCQVCPINAWSKLSQYVQIYSKVLPPQLQVDECIKKCLDFLHGPAVPPLHPSTGCPHCPSNSRYQKSSGTILDRDHSLKLQLNFS